MTEATIRESQKVQFFVPGIAVPKGSMKAFTNPKTGRAILTSASGQRLKDWEAYIKLEATQHIKEVHEGAVFVTCTFLMSRPKSAPKNRLYPTVTPDVDKLARSVLDALTGVAYRDDAQVVGLEVYKRYSVTGQQPGVTVEVENV